MISNLADKHVLYKQYLDKFYAQEIYTLFKRNNIDVEFGDNIPSFDVSFANNTHNQVYELRIKQKDFNSADRLLINHAKNYINDLPLNYYLYDLSNDELMNVIKNKNKYSEVDVALAIQILSNNGLEEDAISLVDSPSNEINKGRRIGGLWVLLGASISATLLVYFHLLIFFIGLCCGFILYATKSSDGSYKYDDVSRKYGLNTIFGVLICSILGLIIKKLYALF